MPHKDSTAKDWLYKIIIENISEAVIMIDDCGHITYFSPAAENLFDFSSEEILGNNVSILMDKNNRHMHDRYIERFFQTGESQIIGRGRDVEGRTKTGQILSLNLRISHIKINGEHCFIGVLRDIGYRKIAETKMSRGLQEKDALNNLLMIGTTNANIHEKMSHGLNHLLGLPWLGLRDQGAIFICQGEKFEGIKLIASRGQSESFLVACDEVESGRCLCGQVALTGELIIANHITPPDESFCCFVDLEEHTAYAWPILSGDQKVKGILLVYIPSFKPVRPENLEFIRSACEILALTIERDEREQALSNAIAQSERANRSKSSFLENLSHELRTPLHAIIGFSRLLIQQGEGFSLEQKDHLEHIENAGEYLLSMVNDLIELSTIEGGNKSLDPQLIDVKDFIKSIEKRHPHNNAESSLSIIVDDLLPLLNIDERALQRIISNLLSNAIKFSPAGAVVFLKALLTETGELKISIIDQGKGMSTEDIPRALQPFQQLHEGHGRVKGGTGVGLAIANSLATLSGAYLDIQSAPNQGTKVDIIFPRKLLTVVDYTGWGI